jgi:aspartate aminotransferase
LFVEEGHEMALVQSYSKNFGLYGERVGCLSVVGSDAENADNVVSQLKICIRPNYSNPPVHGARIVEECLSDERLEQDFRDQCKEMSERIILMRSLLRETLEVREGGREEGIGRGGGGEEEEEEGRSEVMRPCSRLITK